MTCFLGAAEDYRGVAEGDGVFVPDDEADGAPDRTEKKFIARISALSECPKVEYDYNGDSRMWYFAPPIWNLAQPLISASPDRWDVL